MILWRVSSKSAEGVRAGSRDQKPRPRNLSGKRTEQIVSKIILNLLCPLRKVDINRLFNFFA